MKNKIILISVFFLVILTGVVILLINQEQKNETELQNSDTDDITQDWITYNNDEYNFLFKYPKFCEIDLRSNETNTFSINCPTQKDDIYNFLLFTPENNNLTFNEYLLAERNNCQQWLNEFDSNDKDVEQMIVTKTVNDMKIISNDFSCGHNVGSPSEVWLFNKDNDVVVNFVGDIFIDEKNIINKIIDSFKFTSESNDTVSMNTDTLNKSEVTIFTDKNQYSEGETIDIVVRNGLDESIIYSNHGERYWGIEYFKNNEWINPVYEESGGFQLTEESLGSDCYISLYERMPPLELETQSNISSQWNQKICPFEKADSSNPKIVKYIDSGKYRLIFYYGFVISDNDPYKILDSQKIYSNVFTID